MWALLSVEEVLFMRPIVTFASQVLVIVIMLDDTLGLVAYSSISKDKGV